VSALALLAHLAVVLAVPPLLVGVIQRTKAVLAGRRGPPLLQLWYDLARLFRKGTVRSRTTTWVFLAGPVLGLAATLLAALVLPLSTWVAPFAFAGDVVLFAYAFGLARFFTVAAALDTGSAFEGMGAAREASFACLAEPALFVVLLVLVRVTGSTSFQSMLGPSLAAAWPTAAAPLVLVLVSLFVVLLAENCRIPFDDPATHLELTMIHEVMVLDHGGPALGMILYAAALKLFVYGVLLVRVLLPVSTGSLPGDLALLLGGLVALAVGVGLVESTMARLRLVQVPSLLVASGLLAGFGIVLLAG
jgi:formate hydrogenlyase subunit 4